MKIIKDSHEQILKIQYISRKKLMKMHIIIKLKTKVI